MTAVWWGLVLVLAVGVAANLAWRWASRRWLLPCPTRLAWMLEGGGLDRWMGTEATVDRLGLAPGRRVLEVGPGPGRLLIPAARAVGSNGLAVGLDVQGGMLERLRRRAQQAGLTGIQAVLGDGARMGLAGESFDVVYLCTVLGEIPNREGALGECYRVLRQGGRLSITEMFGDPHYQSRATVTRLATAAGFEPEATWGGWWRFTVNFRKP